MNHKPEHAFDIDISLSTSNPLNYQFHRPLERTQFPGPKQELADDFMPSRSRLEEHHLSSGMHGPGIRPQRGTASEWLPHPPYPRKTRDLGTKRPSSSAWRKQKSQPGDLCRWHVPPCRRKTTLHLHSGQTDPSKLDRGPGMADFWPARPLVVGPFAPRPGLHFGHLKGHDSCGPR